MKTLIKKGLEKNVARAWTVVLTWQTCLPGQLTEYYASIEA